MTDERLCAWEECGLPENHPHHRDRGQFEWHPFEAAPSTDEGEARPPQLQFERKPLKVDPIFEEYFERWGYTGEETGIYFRPWNLLAPG